MSFADICFYGWIGAVFALPIFLVSGLGRKKGKASKVIAVALLAYLGFPFAVLAYRGSDECDGLDCETESMGPGETGVDLDRYRIRRVG